MAIHFHTELPLVFTLRHKNLIRNWLRQVVAAEGLTAVHIQDLNYIFCTDDYLHTLNVQYLQHDTLTDVITFDNSETDGKIVGDIFISVERTNDNAQTYQVSSAYELHRVMVHGLLHLLGYKDKSEAESQLMRQKEDNYLRLLTILLQKSEH